MLVFEESPVQVDVPVEDVDGDVAQGEDHPGHGGGGQAGIFPIGLRTRVRDGDGC